MEQAGLFVEGFVYRWNEAIFFWTEWDSSECISPGCHSNKLNSVSDILLNDVLIGVIRLGAILLNFIIVCVIIDGVYLLCKFAEWNFAECHSDTTCWCHSA